MPTQTHARGFPALLQLFFAKSGANERARNLLKPHPGWHLLLSVAISCWSSGSTFQLVHARF